MHLIKKEDQISECPYCNTKISGIWESHFHFDKHYKNINCNNCNKKMWLEVDFLGTGHDNWDKQKINIENRIKILEGKKNGT